MTSLFLWLLPLAHSTLHGQWNDLDQWPTRGHSTYYVVRDFLNFKS
ncbi:hypothetical protein IAG44_12585 [Streptomyces roseirectus]|uniref:Uncharacterized protein n=1 Tax=Streptomyces roseirectus TaxID=2768066 RepID=A0A7H0IBN6_9ACTN|nr:hypothetical protein [Streptomyces roseirectus]QNP70202.1 hypothetical protein IAG44_12585 [Streptomyces roseirectus]